MNQAIFISRTQSSFPNSNRTSPKPPTSPLDHQPCSHPIGISFGNTQLPRPSLSIKTRSWSHRLGPKASAAAAATSSFHETTESFYDLLGISEKGTILEIKQAYKQLVRKYHPDVSPPERVKENTKRFILLQQAYETLSDPKTRALYDQDLSLRLHLAFSARTQFGVKKVWEGKSEWQDRWRAQLRELRRKSTDKDSGQNMSWGARMRRQRCQKGHQQSESD